MNNINQKENNTKLLNQDELTSKKKTHFSSTIAEENKKRPTNIIDDIPVSITVELGKKTIKIKELLEITKESIIYLDSPVDKSLNVFANGHLIATGEIVVVENMFGIKISDICHTSKTNVDSIKEKH